MGNVTHWYISGQKAYISTYHDKAMSVSKDEVLSWLGGKDETSGNLVDIPWKIGKYNNHLVLENEKIPFSIFLKFDEGVMRVFLRTGVETAVMENSQRLAVYRVLLILNRQIDLVKFMLDGIHEEVISRVDLELDALSKNELNDGLNLLLSSIYLMVKTLNLEEQFQTRITERMLLMVQDMIRSGKTKEDIEKFLVEKIGLTKTESDNILNQLMGKDDKEESSGMYA